MMMMTKMADQKRRISHQGELLFINNIQNADQTVGGSCSAKKHGSGQGCLFPKEKKDKVGERVAALQQLVSPFGKTDTATVLEEATGYIKFLHDQLQVLSAPYLRTGLTGSMQEGKECSLRSRGLRLVPTTSALTIARSNGADLWAPVITSNKRLKMD